MQKNKYEKAMATILERIDITEYIRGCIQHIYTQNRRGKLTIRTQSEAERLKTLFNDRHNTTFKSMADIRHGRPYWDEQLVDYVPSNIGGGYIFYFICNDCGRRVKYLYFYSYLYSPLCRKCVRLPYRQATRPERRVSRYMRRHPEGAKRIIDAFIDPWPRPP